MVVKASLQLQRVDTLQNAIAILENKLPIWVYKDIGKGLHLIQFPRGIQEAYDVMLPVMVL